MREMSRLRLIAALAASVAVPAAARIHSLTIENDPRFVFSIESFGFLAGGKVVLDISNVKVTPPEAAHILGFVIYPTATESTINEAVNMLDRDKICALDTAPEAALPINISDPVTWGSYTETASVLAPGLYDLLFTHCAPTSGQAGLSGPVTVSFKLDAAFENPGGNYLSAGDMPLPAIYGLACAAFAVAAATWVWWLRKNRSDTHKVHHLMTLLVCVKAFQLLFESVMYHYIAITGHNSAWNVMFYIFTLMKALIMVVVTLLVASGWSIMRPFLSQREKKVLLTALVLQLLANTAIIVTDELAPGSIAFLEWTDILHIADVIASGGCRSGGPQETV